MKMMFAAGSLNFAAACLNCFDGRNNSGICGSGLRMVHLMYPECEVKNHEEITDCVRHTRIRLLL